MVFSIMRRSLVPNGIIAAAAGFLSAARAAPEDHGVGTPSVANTPMPKRPPPQANRLDFSRAETYLASRNHGMLTELLSHPVTPLGCHYLLVHFDVPTLSEENYSIAIGGRVNHSSRVSLRTLKARRAVHQTVTMECAGTGRDALQPRPVYVPWAENPIGTYRWTGTPLRPLLEQAGVLDDAQEVLFTGWDSGVDMGVEHAFERSLPIAEAMHPEVMLVWAANGQTLLPQHGYPLRLIVPSWYGMASVKWLRAITVLNEPFRGVQQYEVYRYTQSATDPGVPVQRKRVNSLVLPPGIPDLLSRWRFVASGRQSLRGVAWSGDGPISRVDVTTDGGSSWTPATLQRVGSDPQAWVQWHTPWEAAAGDCIIGSRATDTRGNTQPLDPNTVWNQQGNGINSVKMVNATVQTGLDTAQAQVPSQPRSVLPNARMPAVPGSRNQAV